MREDERRRRLGLATVLGLKPRGFFLPHRHADALAPTQAPYAAVAAAFDAARAAFDDVFDRIDRFAPELQAIGADAPAPAPRWNQDWFPRLDAACAYALVRARRPRTIVEIGSGHSTRFLARAIADDDLTTRLVAIDPAPRAALAGLAVEWRRALVQETPTGLFADLRAGDLLFIDSSHVLMPGTDVDHLLNRVLPILPAGVLVHLHDIFLPDDYPPAWAWRGYNEQLALPALILGGAYRPLFASRYAVTRMQERLERGVVAHLPIPDGAFESSLWLEKR
ncbi:MAG: class I SAM-dependent methyltransferase [Alphaproteobacteria bacterium]|nr:class I SAM-dependent methyltransferase [Alphaproteobacteria bacterium]